MSAYGNMYFFKAYVKAENIWDCIRRTFPDYGLTEAMPEHFSIERDNSSLLWDCQNGNKGLAKFRFYADTEDGKRDLTIIFDKAGKRRFMRSYLKKQRMRRIYSFAIHFLRW